VPKMKASVTLSRFPNPPRYRPTRQAIFPIP
jgi:hypothetical protein